jgi:endoglycosylceramidase
MIRAVTVVLLALVACGDNRVPDERDGGPDRWHVARGHLRDASGRAVILRGANVSSVHKSPPYFDFHRLEDFQRMRTEWGMNSVRFLIEWAALEPEDGVYDPDYLDAVAERIDWAGQAGLLVILDMHQDLYGEGFGGNGAPRWSCEQTHYDQYVPVEPWFANYANEHVTACYDQFWRTPHLIDHYVNAWKQVAAKLSGYRAIIGFDVMNEPYWGSQGPATFEEGSLAELYLEVVPAVRASAPAWIAFLEPAASRNLGLRTSLPAFPFGDVVYSPHSYDALAEGGDGFSLERRDAIVTNYDLFRQEAGWLDAALWIGEYGGVAADAGIAEYMDAQYDGAAAVGAGMSYWHYSKDGGYGLLEADGSEKPALLDAIVRPYPERVAGDLVDFAYDEDTRVFTARYLPLASAALTEIIAPLRAYPNGFEVECGGCDYAVSGDVVTLSTAPPTSGGAPAVVTVRPAP